MYIIRNALKCIGRSKGRNVLIGIIVLVIAISACIGLSIRQAAQSAKEETLSGMTVTATISIDRQAMMSNMGGFGGGGFEGGRSEGGGFDKDGFAEMMTATEQLTLEDYKKYAEADSVQDFYYTVTTSLNGTDEFEAVTSDSTSSDQDGDTSGSAKNGMGGFPGGMGGFMMGKRDMNSGDFSIVGYSSDSAMTSFIDGTASIVNGAVFNEGTSSYDCIISEELATYNSTSVGDVITLANPNSEDETYDLTVVGIYSDSSSNEGFQMMPNSDPANEIFMSYNALNSIISASNEVSKTVTDETTGREYQTAVTGTLNSTYVFADVDGYNRFENEVRELGLDDTYTVSSQDVTAFENSLVPLNTLSTMAGWFLVVILLIGAIILIVMNIFNIRERKYEIGVLMAVGMKKRNIAVQFLTEIFVVTIVAVMIGVGVGAVSAVPVTNALLENQISSLTNKSTQIEQNFGRGEMPNMPNMPDMGGEFGGGMEKPDDGGGFGRIENMFGKNAANYVSEINSAMNLTVVVQMLGIAVLLTLVAGAVSMLFVMRYEPLKILANRD